MKKIEHLELQALSDGELTAARAASVAEGIKADSKAQGLLRDLESVRSLLAGNELERAVPESREFYWSKIARRIEAEEAVQPVRGSDSGVAWWLKLSLPLAGAAAILALVVLPSAPISDESPAEFLAQEIGGPTEDAQVISFYSQSSGMTVVWVDTAGY